MKKHGPSFFFESPEDEELVVVVVVVVLYFDPYVVRTWIIVSFLAAKMLRWLGMFTRTIQMSSWTLCTRSF